MSWPPYAEYKERTPVRPKSQLARTIDVAPHKAAWRTAANWKPTKSQQGWEV
jgi:hypothetical protein